MGGDDATMMMVGRATMAGNWEEGGGCSVLVQGGSVVMGCGNDISWWRMANELVMSVVGGDGWQ